MSMTEVVEESLKADPRFRHLTVAPEPEVCRTCSNLGYVDDGWNNIECWNCDKWMDS